MARVIQGSLLTRSGESVPWIKGASTVMRSPRLFCPVDHAFAAPQRLAAPPICAERHDQRDASGRSSRRRARPDCA
jgi:hypothetical protein